MDNRISTEYISTAIDELVSILGLREPPTTRFLLLLGKKKTKLCVKEIASQLGLDIEINLTYVPKDYKAGNANKFDSNKLSRTDWMGRGIEGITAQVYIPNNLPLYSTSALKGFPIDVRVSENCYDRPETFISVMAHELSHVLLYSLFHPQKDNEIYTDLTPMILGFSSIVEVGRKFYETNVTGDTYTTRTTTYGYLTDTQFSFACDKINTLLAKNKGTKDGVLGKLSQNEQLLKVLKVNLHQFKSLVVYLDNHQNKRIKKQDGQRIVQFHSYGYTSDIETDLGNIEKILMEIKNYLTETTHYTKHSIVEIQNCNKKIDSIASTLINHQSSLNSDIKVLVRNVGLVYRIKHAFSRK